MTPSRMTITSSRHWRPPATTATGTPVPRCSAQGCRLCGHRRVGVAGGLRPLLPGAGPATPAGRQRTRAAVGAHPSGPQCDHGSVTGSREPLFRGRSQPWSSQDRRHSIFRSCGHVAHVEIMVKRQRPRRVGAQRSGSTVLRCRSRSPSSSRSTPPTIGRVCPRCSSRQGALSIGWI